ncbi:MAG: CoB--CoM heterodisulfide reductase iron-sulfur subunit A family protein [Bacteroidales bacterium]|nr:CoB--CoM heterodisulfide reductase iron-sulfur subunit A family protein [Bacteroidales bacterium]
MKKKVVVIGAGVAGIEAAAHLALMGYDVTILEKGERIGGHVLQWDRLFPTQRPASEIQDYLNQQIRNPNIRLIAQTCLIKNERNNEQFNLELSDGNVLTADAILVSTGFDLFDARIKEEYGYGIYDNVITSCDLEALFSSEKPITNAQGEPPSRVGFIHCVGSRDEKVGNTYCSQVCCVTAVKQAIEVREKLPRSEVFCFYMDMRMFGLRFEELYKESQEKWGVNFIRGRLSEASENLDGSILIKVEDTLAGRPLKMRVGLLVLMVGFVPSKGTLTIGKLLGLDFTPDGFLKPADEYIDGNSSNIPGIYLSGTCKAPKTIPDTLTDGRAAALAISEYLASTS